jgi:hypothetical protein
MFQSKLTSFPSAADWVPLMRPHWVLTRRPRTKLFLFLIRHRLLPQTSGTSLVPCYRSKIMRAFALCLVLLVVIYLIDNGVVALLKLKDDGEVHGLLLLDSVTFPMFVPHPTHTVVVLVWNQDAAGDYGADSMKEDYVHFADKGVRQGKSENLLFAHVPVTAVKNADVAQRLGIEAGFKFPRLFLFEPGSSVAIPYPTKNPFHDTALTTFVAKHSDFFLGISGLEPRYDDIAKRFRDAHSMEYPALIEEAEAGLDSQSGKHKV